MGAPEEKEHNGYEMVNCQKTLMMQLYAPLAEKSVLNGVIDGLHSSRGCLAVLATAIVWHG
ncbi:hypothetical protein BV914_00735 [Neisseria dumasiana]|nr:hypothetical protein BV914_00735 [Neisseria dumasiana]